MRSNTDCQRCFRKKNIGQTRKCMIILIKYIHCTSLAIPYLKTNIKVMLQQMIKYLTEVFHHKQNAVICYMFALYTQTFAQLGSISYSVCLSTSNVYKLGNSIWRRSFYTLRCNTTVVIISKLSQFGVYFQIFLYSRVRKLKRCFSILRNENYI